MVRWQWRRQQVVVLWGQVGVGRCGSLAYPVDPCMCFGVLYATNALSERAMTQHCGLTRIALGGIATVGTVIMNKQGTEGSSPDEQKSPLCIGANLSAYLVFGTQAQIGKKHCRIPCKTVMQGIGKDKTNQLLNVSAFAF